MPRYYRRPISYCEAHRGVSPEGVRESEIEGAVPDGKVSLTNWYRHRGRWLSLQRQIGNQKQRNLSATQKPLDLTELVFYNKFIFFLRRCFIANIKPGPNPRKRGGQPGNHNALKHGYYARHFRPSEIEDLEQLTPGLQDEINMIRIFIRRVIAGTDPDATLAENLEVMRHLSFATLTLTRLVRTHLLYPVKSPRDELHEEVHKWLDKNVWPPGPIPEGFFDKEQSE